MSRVQWPINQKTGLPLHHQLLPKQTRRCHHDHLLLQKRCSQPLQPNHQSPGGQNYEFPEGTQTQLVPRLTSKSSTKRWWPLCKKNSSAEYSQSIRNRTQQHRHQQLSDTALGTCNQGTKWTRTGQCHRLTIRNIYTVWKESYQGGPTTHVTYFGGNQLMHGMGSSFHPRLHVQIFPQRLKIGIDVLFALNLGLSIAFCPDWVT